MHVITYMARDTKVYLTSPESSPSLAYFLTNFSQIISNSSGLLEKSAASTATHSLPQDIYP